MRAEAPAWAARYIGRSFRDKGRTLDACDCLGLDRIIMFEQTGILVPDVDGYEGTGAKDAATCTRLHEETLAKGDWLPIEAGQEQPFDWLVVRVFGLPWHYAIVAAPGVAIHTMSAKQGSVLLRYRESQYRYTISQPGRKVAGSGFYRHRLMAGRAAA